MIVQWDDLRRIIMDHDLIGQGKPEKNGDLSERANPLESSMTEPKERILG